MKKTIFEHFLGNILKNRWGILAVSLVLFSYGIWQTYTAPVDILPDLNRPTVTIFTEAEGLVAEEVELLVTTQIENVMNGAPGVERVRSISGNGLSLIFVEFDWNAEIYRSRQIVAEKLNAVTLPEGIETTLGPISSLMGEIQLIGVTSKTGQTSPAELRNLADFTIRQKLLTVSGIARVNNIGGDFTQYQIQIDPNKIANLNFTLGEVLETLNDAVSNKSGGFVVTDTIEIPIQIVARTTELEAIANIFLGESNGLPVLLKDIAVVLKDKTPAPRGDATINGKPGVILSVTKQPGQNTLELSEKIRAELATLNSSLGTDIEIHPNLFTQEKFIKNGIDNVIGAARDAGILVTIILLVFLGNLRAVGITLFVLPFSFVTSIAMLRYFGISLNVMTLGGLAVAIGSLTDDAVVTVENIIRWLKIRTQEGNKISVADTIVKALNEVRGSIIFSTILVILVFLPLFALSSIEGRLLAPLGIAYILVLIVSTIVAMTVTAVLSYFLLPKSKLVLENKETWLVQSLKRITEPLVRWSIRNAKFGLIIGAISTVLTAGLFIQAGKDFLPPFNEGTLTIGVSLAPGTSITKSNEVGGLIDQALLSVTGVEQVARRTGRAESDEHANGVNVSEYEVDISIDADKDDVIASIKEKLSVIDLSGANVSIGQPISHRIEHILSGVRAPLVIKIFGPELDKNRRIAEQVRDLLESIPGTLNPVVEQEVSVPQAQIIPNRDQIGKAGFALGEFTEIIETALAGNKIGTLLEGNRSFDLTVRLAPKFATSIEDLRKMPIHTPVGQTISLSQLAEVKMSEGRNSISHDNGQRRTVVSSGILEGDSVTIIENLKQKVEQELTIPTGYFVSYEGTYKSQKESSRRLFIFAVLAFLGILGALYYKFRSWSLVFQVIGNIPVVYLGAMVAVLLTDNVVSLASLVGLIAIFGLAARNGILLIERWMFMAVEEKIPFGEEMIIAGSLSRISPMLMTALTSMFALFPLILVPDEPGKELLYPLSVVMFGGLLTSTIVEVIIRPGIFALFGKKSVEKALKILEK
jgi:CzcA family heavy metal efflux pump